MDSEADALAAIQLILGAPQQAAADPATTVTGN